jgi:hypothetical protein
VQLSGDESRRDYAQEIRILHEDSVCPTSVTYAFVQNSSIPV